MIFLPDSPNRLRLLSFWISLVFLLGIVVGIPLLLTSQHYLIIPWILILVILIVVGFKNTALVSGIYRVWNNLAHAYGSLALYSITGICFYVILLITGRAGSILRISREETKGKSHWKPRETLHNDSYDSMYNSLSKNVNDRGAIRSLFDWSMETKNYWVICLIPFLLLIRVLETEEHKEFPSNIYTLY
jgi:hypothetical protein